MISTSVQTLLNDRQLQLLDALERPVLVSDARGCVVHRTPALQRCLRSQSRPERGRLECELERVVDRLVARLRTGGPRSPGSRPGVLTREVRSTRATYRLRGILLPPEVVAGDAGAILVELERTGIGTLSEDDLGVQFGLTAREIEVSRLLARGMSDGDIAERLGISTRTAEHHAEHVLRKLGVTSRSAVAALLRAAGG
jgi:DNA-binding CsgD family transcriptional regulator